MPEHWPGPGNADNVPAKLRGAFIMAKFKGTTGDDNLVGTDGNDTFTLSQGGNDTASGGGGNDKFLMGATFNAGDAIDGGDGTDTVSLKGDYSAGLVLHPNTIVNVEKLLLNTGFDYTIATDDGNVAAGETLTIDGSRIRTANHLIFDGSNETDGSFAIIGGSGDDTVTGGGQRDTFNLTKGGNDTAHGGAGNDLFTMAATLTSADAIDGGTGIDRISLAGNYAGANAVIFTATTLTNVETISLATNHGYDLTSNDATVALGQTLTVDGSALGATDRLTFNGSAETDGHFAFQGGAGIDVLTGGALSDTFALGEGGNDIVSGGGGDDVFTMGAGLTSADKIDGGTGNDTVSLSGDYSAGVSFGAATMVNVETLQLAAGHGYNLITGNATVAAGQTLTVAASALGAGDALTFNGGAETDGAFSFLAGAGNDALTGGAQADSFDLSKGGDDTVHGGGGNDSFALGGALTATDAIDGGSGIDTLSLNGDYSAGLVLGAATITNIETLQLVSGHDYNITTDDGTLAAGQTLTIDGSQLTSARHLTFNGIAETNGSFAITGGAGNDTLTGGAQADSFNLTLGGNDTAGGGGGNDTFTMGAALTAADILDGGMGSDTVVLNGDYSAGLTLGANTIANIETLQFAAGHSYSVTTNNANVAAGLTLAIDGSALGITDALTFNGAAETNGSFAMTGGAGNDALTGGALADTFDLSLGGNDTVHAGDGADTINAGGALTAADAIDGGTGSDVLVLNGDYSAGVAFGAATMTNVETLRFAAGHSYAITTADANVASGQSLTVDGSALGAADALTFNGAAETNGSFAVTGGAGNDTLSGGSQADSFDLSLGGNDTVHAGDGADTINAGAALTAADTIDGGAGSDVLILNGDYSAGLTLGAATMTAVETLRFTAGHSYAVTSNDANVASAQTLTVDGSGLGASDTLTFNGNAETNGSFAITGGAGNDALTGGALADTFDLSKGGDDTAHGGGGNDTFNVFGALTATDTLDGGTGSDTVVLNGDYSAGLTLGAATIAAIETLQFAAGHSYNLITNDANVAAGQSLTVDGSALGAGDALTFDGSAELDGSFVFTGGAGNDVLSGGALADSFDFSHGGIDTAHGNGGNDTFTMGAALAAADAIDGGSGTDKIVLDGDYSGGVAFTATTITNIETLQVAAGHSYNLTTDDGNVASGQTLTVDASGLGAANALTFNGVAETDGSFAFIGGAGNDVLTGGALADNFDLTLGGNDTAHGGGGDDTFKLGATLTPSDAIDGGAGNDTVILSGDYSAGMLFTATTLSGVETLQLGAGNSYKFTGNDANVAAGATLTVNATALTGTNTMSYNGAAETDGAYRFMFAANYNSTTDALNGGSHIVSTVIDPIFTATGYASTLELRGDYSNLIIGANAINGIGDIVLDQSHNYHIKLNGFAVATGQSFIIDDSTADNTSNNTIDVSGETHGNFYLIAGHGNDTLIGGGDATYFDISRGGAISIKGGAGDDVVYAGNAGFIANEDGGAGNDSLVLNGNFSGGLDMNGGMVSVETLAMMESGFNYKLKLYDATVAAGKTLIIDGSQLTSSLIFDGSNESNGFFNVIGGAGNDTLQGGTKADTFDLTHGGSDVVNGDGGADIFNMGAALDANDNLSGAGTGIINLSGDYSAGLTMNATTFQHMDTMNLTGGFDYKLIFDDGNVATNQELFVKGQSAHNVYLDASAETTGTYLLYGGSGDSTLIGGAGNDVLVVQNGHNVLTGGGGHDSIVEGGFPGSQSDTLTYNAVSDSTSTTYDQLDFFAWSHVLFQVSHLGGATTGIDAQVSGAMSDNTFDADLAAGVNAAHLAAHHAVEFMATSGTDSGDLFLVIDENGVAGYQAGADLVFQIVGFTGSLSMSNFG
jgi:Ca2+-binding RTX toxin-like protein